MGLIFTLVSIALFSLSLVLLFMGRIAMKKTLKNEDMNKDFLNKASNSKLKASALSFVAVVTLVFASVNIVSEGEVLTQVCLGKRDASFVKGAGIYFNAPYCEYTKTSIKEESYKFYVVEDLSNAPMTKDLVKMNTIVNFPVSINGLAVPHLLSKYGTEDLFLSSVVENSFYDAVRRGFAEFYWEVPEGNTSAKEINDSRDELVKAIRDSFVFIVSSKLEDAGFDKEVIKSAFIVGYPTISGIVPPDSITRAIEEQKKAEAELSRQSTLTAVATEKAKRGTQEGLRIANMLKSIPGVTEGNSTPESVTMLLTAIADSTKAEALETAVKEGNIEMWVIDGGSSPSVAPRK